MHLKQHDDILNGQLNPLVDEINSLADKLSQLYESFLVKKELAKLQTWRQEAICIVDNYYEHTCRRLKAFVSETLDEQREELKRLQATVAEHAENQDVTKDSIDWISNGIDRIRKELLPQEAAESLVKIRPLIIDDDLIEIDWLLPELTPFDISSLSRPYLSKYLNENCCYDGMAATGNGQYLLLHTENTLQLFDHLLQVKQQIKWDHGYVRDICYASSLDKFILFVDSWESSGVFTVQASSMTIEKILDEQFKKSACSDTHLYLLKEEQEASTLYQYTLANLELRRFSIFIEDESIRSMSCNSDMLALIIFHRTWTKIPLEVASRLEVRSTAGKLEKVWSIPMEFGGGTFAHNSLISINTHGWLVTDAADRRLTHISTDGKIQSILIYNHGRPIQTALLGTDSLIVKTENNHIFEVAPKTIINLHKLYWRE